jgi:hypothetical protein
MKILHYSDLNLGKLKKQFKKVEGFLAKGDFKSADVKKMVNSDYYRAKLDDTNRLLFKFATYQAETYVLLLEVIHNHAYDKSRFLRGAEVKENNFTTVATVEKVAETDKKPLVYINPNRTEFHLLDKFISLDEEQTDIYGMAAPLIIIGSAGSGKTALTLEKMKHFSGKVAYVSLSPYLVENAQTIYYANNYDNSKQEIDFLSFKEYIEMIHLPKGREITFKDFERWYSRYRNATKIKEDYKLFEEFKGVLTGSVTEKPYLSREDYLGLGIKQSIFLAKERVIVYDVFEKYVKFLEEGRFYDSNIVAFNYLEKASADYDFLVVDEVQDLTNIQLMLILKSLKSPTNFLLSGDSNQIVHPNFFSWSKLKSMFYLTDFKGSLIRILKTNYRNSHQITELSNTLLKIKNARFGSIDKESTYLIDTVSENKGEINFFEDSDKIKKELNSKTENSAKFAILVMNNDDKGKVRKYFKTPLVFSIQEAKGLEYENIILVNFISNYDKEFREITNGVTSEDLTDEAFSFNRAKDKSNKELEAYKFYVNSLYVAFTRAVKNIYVIESNRKQPILELLDIKKTVTKVNLDKQQSDNTEWLEEADRLEQQGKQEQAQQIRDRLKGIDYISPEELEIITEQALDTKANNNVARKRLMSYIEARFDVALLNQLADINYLPAIAYRRKLRSDLKDFERLCRNNRTKGLEKSIEKYNINIQTTKELETGLMLGLMTNGSNVIDYFLERKSKTTIQNYEGLIPLQIAIRSYDREKLSSRNLIKYYPLLKMPFVRCKSTERVVKINERTMEFFLLHYLLAVRDDLIDKNDPPAMQGLTMDEFMEFIEEMPESILPEYRRKRQYVNSILAKNEIARDDRYNRKLFKRVSRGTYNLNGDMKIEYL